MNIEVYQEMYKIIIVDDESLALEQLASIVDWELFGFEVYRTFSSGKEALECLRIEKIDFVLTDICMPGIDGVDLARFCYENNPDTFVAFISSYDSFEYARKAVKYNIVDYILKPFSYSQITDLIEHVAMLLDDKNNNSFIGDEIQVQREKFFSDVFFGNIKSSTALRERLQLIKLSEDLVDSPVQVIALTINNYDEYLKTTWKYGKDRFYCAISNIVFEDGPDLLCCISMYSYNNVRIVAIIKNKDDDLKKEIEKYCERVSNDLFELIMLSTEIKVVKQYDSLEKIVETGNEHEKINEEGANDIKQKIMQYIEKNYCSNITLADLAGYMCYNKVYFCSLYRKHMNENFTTTLNRMRIEKAKEMLKNTNLKGSTIFDKIGYKSAPYFYKIFKSFTGMTPADYQKQMKK